MPIDMTQLAKGSSGRIVSIAGTDDFKHRIEAMGIHKDALVTKKSAQPFKGPIVVQLGQTQVAIGYSMAKKIEVEPITAPSSDKMTI